MSFLRASSSIASFASSSASARCWFAIRSTSAFHTSTVHFAESQKQRTARLVRKSNIEKKAERARLYAENKPHVVLGTRPGEEDSKWRDCDLAKTLVTTEELSALPPTPTSGSGLKVELPEYTSYGLDGHDGTETRDEQLQFFFSALPDTSAVTEAGPELADRFAAERGQREKMNLGDKRAIIALQEKEAEKARQLARIVDLRNANARGVAFENRRRIIATFSPTKNATDSGYPEVQVALLTMKIRNVWSHLMQRKKDVHSRRALRLLIHQRAKMLKYIKRIDRDRYDTILERVALDPESVEGELVV